MRFDHENEVPRQDSAEGQRNNRAICYNSQKKMLPLTGGGGAGYKLFGTKMLPHPFIEKNEQTAGRHKK